MTKSDDTTALKITNLKKQQQFLNEIQRYLTIEKRKIKAQIAAANFLIKSWPITPDNRRAAI
jgi:hypothetical protein